MITASVASALAWTLAHFVWQGVVIGLVAFVLLTIVRRSRVRYLVGVGALVAMLVAPVVTFGVLVEGGVRNAPSGAAQWEPAAFDSGTRLTTPDQADAVAVPVVPERATGAGAALMRAIATPAVTQVIVLVWLAGVLALSVRMAGGLMVARRLVVRGVRPVASDMNRLAAQLARRLELRRAVRVLESSRVAVPMVVGWVKPVVLLPTAALAGLSPTQLEALLAHELAHIRRHDYLVNLLQSVVETLLFYHPAVWWVSRQVRAERELCCDEIAVGVCDRLVYASALADLAVIDATPRFALAATDGSLLDRVRRVLGGPERPKQSRLRAGWPVLVALLLTGGSVMFVISEVNASPTWSSTTLYSPVPQAPDAADPNAPTRVGSGMSAYSVNGDRIDIRWTGSFRLSADEKSIEWVEPGKSVKITNGGRWFTTGVEITADSDGRLSSHHFGSGFERPWEPDGRLYLEQAIQKLVVRTGLNAQVHVARLLASGGPDAVRAGMARLETDSARRAYYRELIAQADLSATELVSLVDEAAKAFRSDSYRSQLLTSVAPKVAGNEEALMALIGSSKSIASDSYQRRALTELMPAQPSPAIAAAVLDAASGIGSDSYRQQVLLAVAENGGLTAETQPAYFALVDGMRSPSYRGRVLRAVGTGPEAQPATVRAVLASSRGVSSDTERRRVVQAVMGEDQVDPEVSALVLETVGAVRSASERATLLREFVSKGGLTTETAPAFFELVATTSSGSYQRRIMNDVSALPELSPAILGAFLDAARRVRGDTERTSVLMDLVEKHVIAGENRARFLAAAKSIGSRTSEDRVLAALVRAELSRSGGGRE